MIEIMPTAISDSFLDLTCQIPLIICTNSTRLYRKLTETGYQEFELNALLSKALLAYTRQERLNKVESEFKKLIPDDVPIIIT